jgi:hypothetical protein
MACTYSTTEEHFCRMLKKARRLTCRTLAPQDKLCPKQAAAKEGPRRTLGEVEDLNDARTLLADVFSILRVASFGGSGTG